LILLVGVVLAAVAFVAIVFLFSGNTGTPQPTQATDADTVIAAVDIPLGTQVRADMLTTHKVLLENRATDAYGDASLVIGQIARANIVANAQITKLMFATTGIGTPPGPLLARGLRAQAVQVDQVTGVGTLINVGDRVDAVVGFGGGGCGASFPVVTVDPTTDTVTPVAGLSSITVKLLLQNMQVVSTLLPPVATTNGQPQASPAAGGGTTLNGQQEIVVLAVTAQQSEVIKYAQTDGCISLVLRSPKDFVDDAGNTTEPPPDPTSGIILKALVDEYGVLPPQVVEAILPKK
jgi:Flp pilus assembly protein CpaB